MALSDLTAEEREKLAEELWEQFQKKADERYTKSGKKLRAWIEENPLRGARVALTTGIVLGGGATYVVMKIVAFFASKFAGA